MEGEGGGGGAWQLVTELRLRRRYFSLASPTRPPSHLPPILRCLSEALGLDAVVTAPISNPTLAHDGYITTAILTIYNLLDFDYLCAILPFESVDLARDDATAEWYA